MSNTRVCAVDKISYIATFTLKVLFFCFVFVVVVVVFTARSLGSAIFGEHFAYCDLFSLFVLVYSLIFSPTI